MKVWHYMHKLHITKWMSYSEFYFTYLEPNSFNFEAGKNGAIPYLLCDQDNLICLIVDEDDNIKGACGIQQSPYLNQEDLMWLKFVSVHADSRGKGLSHMLVESILEYCRTHDKSLLASSYTEDGLVRLKHLIDSNNSGVTCYSQEDTYDINSTYNQRYLIRNTSDFSSNT